MTDIHVRPCDTEWMTAMEFRDSVLALKERGPKWCYQSFAELCLYYHTFMKRMEAVPQSENKLQSLPDTRNGSDKEARSMKIYSKGNSEANGALAKKDVVKGPYLPWPTISSLPSWAVFQEGLSDSER